MKRDRQSTFVIGVLIIGLFTLLDLSVGSSSAAEKPKSGGILTFACSVEPPTFDAHRESTFGVIHVISPHYSTLLKYDENHYPKIVGDLAESWIISEDKKTYTFKVQKGVKFHDGSLLTSRDIKASYDKIIFPPSGVVSFRQSFYSAVEKIEIPDTYTVVFRLKWPSPSFFGNLASAYNYIYKADILARDPRWYEKNIMGTGPFKFVEYVPGSHWVGKRNEDYFIKGRPYLDGYRVIFIPDTGARLAAIRGGRVQAEFRGFTPTEIESVVRAMGKNVQIMEADLINAVYVYFNCEKPPFNDPRVRRALNLAINRWEGAKVLSRITNVKKAGGLLRPGSEFAMTEEELAQVAGFSKDIEASRKEARRLLREANVPEGFSFEMINRPPPMPYETIAVWLIDQWRQIGLNVTQKPRELGAWYQDCKSGNFNLAVYAIGGDTDDPAVTFLYLLSDDKSPLNFGHYKDRILDALFVKQDQTIDPAERRELCKKFQLRALDEMSYGVVTPWWNRIVALSPEVRGVKLLPSLYLNQDLVNIWLEKK